jgi:hypothetical protein
MTAASRRKWVATIRGSGTGVFHVETTTREQLEERLGDLLEEFGRLHWTIEERKTEWHCDGRDGCGGKSGPDEDDVRDQLPEPQARR